MIEIHSDKSRLDVDKIQKFLSQTYWNQGITKGNVQKCIENSLNFGMNLYGEQIGYARVVTDYYRFAYLLDVFIEKEFQGQGYGKKLMEFIFSQEELAQIKIWKLGIQDAHDLYKKFGFTALEKPENIMERKI